MKINNILVVDDNEDLATGLTLILEDEGYQVSTAYTGEAAIAASQEKTFELLLLDAKLPDGNGIRIGRDILQRQPASLPIIMTGFRLEQLIAETTGHRLPRTLHDNLPMPQLVQLASELPQDGIAMLGSEDRRLLHNLLQGLKQRGIRTTGIDAQGRHGAPLDDGELLILSGDNAIDALMRYIDFEAELAHRPTLMLFGAADHLQPGESILRSAHTTGCLFKPFDPRQLLEMLDALKDEPRP